VGPVAAAVALADGSHDRERRVRTRAAVDEARPDTDRRAVAIAGDRHQPGDRLNTGIVAGIGPVRAGSAEPRQRAVDHVLVSRPNRLVVEIVLLENAGPEAFDDHVGLVHEFGDDRMSGFGLHVDTEALFAVIEGCKMFPFMM